MLTVERELPFDDQLRGQPRCEEADKGESIGDHQCRHAHCTARQLNGRVAVQIDLLRRGKPAACTRKNKERGAQASHGACYAMPRREYRRSCGRCLQRWKKLGQTQPRPALTHTRTHTGHESGREQAEQRETKALTDPVKFAVLSTTMVLPTAGVSQSVLPL